MNYSIFLSVKDLMQLTGYGSYSHAAMKHRLIRDLLKMGKRKLTIKEYCEFESIDFEYVWSVLREKKK